MDELLIVVEVAGDNPEVMVEAIGREAYHRLGLRVGVELAAQPLPRFEMKASRVIDKRLSNLTKLDILEQRRSIR